MNEKYVSRPETLPHAWTRRKHDVADAGGRKPPSPSRIRRLIEIMEMSSSSSSGKPGQEAKLLRSHSRIRRLMNALKLSGEFRPRLCVPEDDDERYTNVTYSTASAFDAPDAIDGSERATNVATENSAADVSTNDPAEGGSSRCCDDALAQLSATLRWLVGCASDLDCVDEGGEGCRCAPDDLALADTTKEFYPPEVGVEVPYNAVVPWDGRGDVDRLMDLIDGILNEVACGKTCGTTCDADRACGSDDDDAGDAVNIESKNSVESVDHVEGDPLPLCAWRELTTTEVGGDGEAVPPLDDASEEMLLDRLLRYLEEAFSRNVSCRTTSEQVEEITLDARQSRLLLALMLRRMEEVILPEPASDDDDAAPSEPPRPVTQVVVREEDDV